MALPAGGLCLLGRWGVSQRYKASLPVFPVDSTILPPLVAAASFIVGSVLSNVMSDYKESEKIPSELLSYFQSITSFARTAAAAHGADARPLLLEVESMLLCVLATLDAKASFREALPCFEASWQAYMRKTFALSSHIGLEELEVPLHSVQELQKKWARINDISKNSIVLPGYMLMDLITVLMIAVGVAVRYKNMDKVGPTDTTYSTTYKDDETSGYWACFIFCTLIINRELAALDARSFLRPPFF